MKLKTREEVEQIAFKALRNDQDKKLLSNTSITCYVRGFEKAQSSILQTLVNPKEIIDYAVEQIDHADSFIRDSAGYSGRYYTEKECVQLKLLQEMKDSLTAILNSENMKKFLEQ